MKCFRALEGGLIMKSARNRAGSLAILVGSMILFVVPGFGAAVTFTFVEGDTYRLLNNGVDIPTIVTGMVGICEPGVVPCDATTPATGVDNETGQSDFAFFVPILNVAGGRIGTNLLFCSDATTPDAGDNLVPGCTGVWANFNKFIPEIAAVGGVETTPYTPVAGEPGFWPGNVTTYNLISDVPEPSSFSLVSTSLLSVLGAVFVKRWRQLL
jgi:hypothetical protein